MTDTPQCFCKSYYDENNTLQDCTCGKCTPQQERWCEGCLVKLKSNEKNCFYCGKDASKYYTNNDFRDGELLLGSKPNISPQQESWRTRFENEFGNRIINSGLMLRFREHPASKDIQDFISSERTRLLGEVRRLVCNNDVYLLPPGVKRVYGYSEDETTRIKAICITKDLDTLGEK